MQPRPDAQAGTTCLAAFAGSPVAIAGALVAVDPAGLGGVVLRASAGPLRDGWLACLRAAWPDGAPVRRLPLHAADGQLEGGLDLAASLRDGRSVLQPGWLAQLDGGLAIVANAERLGLQSAARLARVLDTGQVQLACHGQSAVFPARMAVVALDEGLDADEQLPVVLRDRLAFHLLIDAPAGADVASALRTQMPAAAAAARRLLPQVQLPDSQLQSLCAAGMALGVESLRASLMAVRTARALAALDGRIEVQPSDCALAASLVLAPRATRLPQDAAEPPPAQAEGPSDTQPPAQSGVPTEQDQAPDAADAVDPLQGSQAAAPPAPGPDVALDGSPASTETQQQSDDVVLQAARAAIPAGLLASLQAGAQRRGPAPSRQGSGTRRDNAARGVPAGTRPGQPGSGARLNISATLRAAAPWQRIRRAQWEQLRAQMPAGAQVPATVSATAPAMAAAPRVLVRRADFHVSRYTQRRETTTIFAVDASGSAALHRLAEAKGAVELLLAECYVRRDRVAVLAFRGRQAQVLLPPTRSLVRARRSLAGLPGGGGTPLAAGLDAVRELAAASAGRGETPVIVVLTDGRANIARDGSPGRARAMDDAMAAAHTLRAAGWASLLLDTSPQPQPSARQLSDAMGGSYLPLPHAGAAAMSKAVSSFMSAMAPGS